MTARTVAVAALVVMIASMAVAQEEFTIRDVVVEGGMTLTVDTVAYYLGLEPGDPLDTELISDGFHRLWDSGLFEDLHIELEQTDDGEVIIYVVVEERPFVTAVEFEGNKKLKATASRSSNNTKNALDGNAGTRASAAPQHRTHD